jgi:hypothetical protein
MVDEKHAVHYERIPVRALASRGSFQVPPDVVARLGGDDVAHTVMANTFNFHPLNVPVGTVPGDVLRELGDGNIAAGRKVLTRFVSMVRRRHTTKAHT